MKLQLKIEKKYVSWMMIHSGLILKHDNISLDLTGGIFKNVERALPAQ